MKLHRILPHPLIPRTACEEGKIRFPPRLRGGLGWGSILCNFILNWYYLYSHKKRFIIRLWNTLFKINFENQSLEYDRWYCAE